MCVDVVWNYSWYPLRCWPSLSLSLSNRNSYPTRKLNNWELSSFSDVLRWVYLWSCFARPPYCSFCGASAGWICKYYSFCSCKFWDSHGDEYGDLINEFWMWCRSVWPMGTMAWEKSVYQSAWHHIQLSILPDSPVQWLTAVLEFPETLRLSLNSIKPTRRVGPTESSVDQSVKAGGTWSDSVLSLICYSSSSTNIKHFCKVGQQQGVSKTKLKLSP
jgi:hypothetical protein